VSNLPVAMRMKTIAAPFAAIFAALALVVAHGAHSTVGLPVRIAKTRPCRPYEDDVRRVFVQVLRPGMIQLNNEPLQTQELEGRLEAIFRTRVYRYVLVTCTAGFPSAAIASSCLTARCDSIWYGFFIATLLFSAKENSLSAYQGRERGVAAFYDLPGIPANSPTFV